jgi:signal transduction histidine kinase
MRALIRVLAGGFTVVILLLAAAAAIGVRNARSISAGAASLAADQLVITRLLDEVEREQEALNAAFYRLSRTPEKVDRDALLAALDQTDRQIAQLADQSGSGPDGAAWNDLRRAVLDFSTEARHLLGERRVPQNSSRDLFFRHEQVTAMVAHLVDRSYARALDTQARIARESGRLERDSAILVGASLAVALFCAVFTVRIAVGVFHRMELQAGELSRVSFRMLEVQEETARRFSHELHDELGGALTAIKSNLNAMPPGERRDDSLKVVDDAISNVRELSQLLRPTILDDFGLTAGIRWLAERFQQRTSIEVEFHAAFDGRLGDETETHLFRIVQEALTNVARHAGATRVTIDLESVGHTIRLKLADNGAGLKEGGTRGMGLNGIAARARTIGGELKLRSQPGAGLTLEVSAPLTRPVEVTS